MVEIFIFILINEETVKIETGSKLGFAIVATSRLRAESFKLSVWLQEWLHAEVGKARRNCDLYVFSASRKHFISTHSLPTVFIRANPHRPPRPLREIRSPPFQICSLPPSAPSPSPRVWHFGFETFPFLASQDALEVIVSVSQWVSESLTLRSELTDVTLVSEDTYWRLYWETLIINDTYWGDVREIVVLIMEVDKVVDEVTDMEIDK